MGRQPLRILVLDDYPLVHGGVAAMLEPRPDLFTPLSARLRELPQQGADIALRDVTGASIHQLQELVAWLRRHRVRHVVAFVWQFSAVQAQQCFDLGFAGIVSKRVHGTELMQALVQVDRGQRVTVHGGSRRQTTILAPASAEQFQLSPREKQMLICIGHAMTNDEIAQQTGLGPNTVKSYTRTAYRKIGVSSRATATAWALNHLIDLEDLTSP